MKERFKFRVWDKENKQMFYQKTEEWFDDMVGFRFNHFETEEENLILMQSTGLKDKNEKLIYNGDCIKMHQFLFDGEEIEEEHTGIVKYNENTCSYNFTKIKGKFYSNHTGYEEGEDIQGTPICFFYGLHEESFEVIGNIYENPELLIYITCS